MSKYEKELNAEFKAAYERAGSLYVRKVELEDALEVVRVEITDVEVIMGNLRASARIINKIDAEEARQQKEAAAAVKVASV